MKVASALEIRNCIWAINLCGFLDLFGVSMLYPLLIKQAQDLGASPSLVGLFGSLYGGIQLLSSPLMGQISDRSGRKALLLVSLVGTGASYLAMGRADSILLLILARIPSGIFKHSQTMGKLIVGDIVWPGNRAAAFGTFNSVSSIGFIIGPTLGGAIAMLDNGFQKVATLASAIFFINSALMWWLIPDTHSKLKQGDVSRRQSESSASHDHAVSSILCAFKQINWFEVWDVFLIGFLFSLSMFVFRFNLTSVLTHRFGTTAQSNGYILSFNGVVSAASGASLRFLTPWFPSTHQMHTFFTVMLTLSLGLITAAPGLTWVVAGFIPLCVASSVLRVTHASALHERSSVYSRGLVSGMDGTLTALARACGPAVAGVAQECSIFGPGLSGTTIAAVATALGFIVVPKRRRHEHVE